MRRIHLDLKELIYIIYMHVYAIVGAAHAQGYLNTNNGGRLNNSVSCFVGHILSSTLKLYLSITRFLFFDFQVYKVYHRVVH